MNGMADPIHVLINLSPVKSIAEIVEELKKSNFEQRHETPFDER
jgi:REP element-mobilizing transposase RayT